MQDSARAWRTCLDDPRRAAAACAHQSNLLACLLSPSLTAVSPNSTSALQGWKAPSASEAIRMEHPWELRPHKGLPGCHLGRGASAGRRTGCSSGCKPSTVLGAQGLHKRLYNTPLPGVWAQLQFWLQNRKLQKPRKYIVWSLIWNKAMLQG